jgi:hypothetical protein
VRDAGRYHDNIACPNQKHGPATAAEPYGGLAVGNAKGLVRRAIEVLKRMHAVAPCRRPAICAEDRRDGGRVRRYRTAAEELNSGWNERSSSNVNESALVILPQISAWVERVTHAPCSTNIVGDL